MLLGTFHERFPAMAVLVPIMNGMCTSTAPVLTDHELEHEQARAPFSWMDGRR